MIVWPSSPINATLRAKLMKRPNDRFLGRIHIRIFVDDHATECVAKRSRRAKALVRTSTAESRMEE